MKTKELSPEIVKNLNIELRDITVDDSFQKYVWFYEFIDFPGVILTNLQIGKYVLHSIITLYYRNETSYRSILVSEMVLKDKEYLYSLIKSRILIPDT